ncbi:hypothetical protein DICPUDRAFT_150317 [Dictyostelium purpureum]|uniref:DDE Tnp4 domain-containing protein n=1 Tax=Dictyostelium purpureum TaxID=5786 RepID=F0ZG08_DICPU|nr:uncharacterized protein DICPUDRAFT_150317 [Dictyostelium purpureum]EGC37134.1 hypothetical protein DICPUDRAFT_150317 [Dictyostelium purpureum]|eukprot:XP_003286337.1 hypothetical protein DICPUDRAFT_150317 [Dictyostelium purpureum]
MKALLGIETLEDIQKINSIRFKSKYWLDKYEFLKIYNSLNIFVLKKFEKDKNNTYINDNTAQADYFLSISKNFLFKLLMFLNYIKSYPTSQQFSTTWGKDHKTILKYRSHIIDIFLEYFYENPIDPSSRLTQKPLEIIAENQSPTGETIKKKNLIYSVIDTTIFKISKPVGHKNESPYYSDKHKFHGVKIQTIVNITDGKLNHISRGTFPGSMHDFEIAKKIDFKEDYPLIENELILGDLGYQGDQGDQKVFLCANIRGADQNGENLSPMD